MNIRPVKIQLISVNLDEIGVAVSVIWVLDEFCTFFVIDFDHIQWWENYTLIALMNFAIDNKGSKLKLKFNIFF